MSTFEMFSSAPPLLHHWPENRAWDFSEPDGAEVWSTGGFEPRHLRFIHEFGRKNLPSRPRIIETGAGNSTICFLFLDPAELVTIAPDSELFSRIENYCRQIGLPLDPLKQHVNGSQWLLPDIASASRNAPPRFDLALIDGNHNWPMVMVDFFYLNFMVKQGGFIMLDDVQLHSVKELARLLAFDERLFRVVGDMGKALIFRKETPDREFGDWHKQAYLESRSWRPMGRYSLDLGTLRAIAVANRAGRVARKVAQNTVGRVIRYRRPPRMVDPRMRA